MNSGRAEISFAVAMNIACEASNRTRRYSSRRASAFSLEDVQQDAVGLLVAMRDELVHLVEEEHRAC